MTSISLKNVAKKFGSVSVLSDINLEIKEGEFCVFLGPSGCGKSTLLRMIAGIEETKTGELRIGGELMNDVLPADRRVAMVFQNYALYPQMTVYENMAFGLRQAKRPKDEIDRRVRVAAQTLQIEALLDRKPKALSGGQRQRVAIGRAIVRQPAVFLFDEPLSNLDAALRVHMRTEIANLHRDFAEASMVYVTHDQTEAMALADKIVLLRAGPDVQTLGSVAQVGTPLDLYHRPSNLFVAGFLGSPAMNFLPAEFLSSDAAGVTVRFETEETLNVPVKGDHLSPGCALTLGIRPEHMVPSTDETQIIRRAVHGIENFGEYSYLYLTETADAPFIAKVAGDMLSKPQGPMAFRADPAACHLFDTDGSALAPLNDSAALDPFASQPTPTLD
ncbi:ABC transporter ATP-binding protein [Cohaesibacter celericrescens]|uniref:ABC transporter n=1 Tax=Cohaesibacter celericrescens TaxID=2067669 RepID=A0A2N5XNL3_9HYPH|nr:ATP-binding cassette domain-containing protein [Cohaesibacter celericrescens]PLW76082.1 ABC transporter [Cohaesibacter celericrescens]